MPLIHIKKLSRKLLRNRPSTLFVFGDNMKRTGLGGQAEECRGEPNAVGIPTKWLPLRVPAAYFCDADLDDVRGPIDEAFEQLESHLKGGGVVAWPSDGVGTGLANLACRAPYIQAYIQERYRRLVGLASQTSYNQR